MGYTLKSVKINQIYIAEGLSVADYILSPLKLPMGEGDFLQCSQVFSGDRRV